jgi:hypothetical protein
MVTSSDDACHLIREVTRFKLFVFSSCLKCFQLIVCDLQLSSVRLSRRLLKTGLSCPATEQPWRRKRSPQSKCVTLLLRERIALIVHKVVQKPNPGGSPA